MWLVRMGERIIRDIQSIVHSDGWLDLGLERFVQVKRQQANVIGAITSGSLLSQMLLLPPTASSEDIAAAADTAQRLLSEDLLSSDKQSAGDTARLKLSSYYGPWLSNLQQAEETRRQLEELESRKRDAEEVELRGRMTKMKAYVQFLLTMDGTNQSKVNPFYSLGLPPTYASAAVMRKLKKELVVMTHPDKVPATPEFADLKEKAKSAFQIVGPHGSPFTGMQQHRQVHPSHQSTRLSTCEVPNSRSTTTLRACVVWNAPKEGCAVQNGISASQTVRFRGQY